MTVTIRKIAEMAGVSVGTVDRALNNRGRINPKVAERIMLIAKEVDYQPNKIAKTLSINKRKLRFAVILHVMDNQFVSTVLQGVQAAAVELKSSGTTVDVIPCKDFDALEQARLIDQAVNNGYNAIALIPLNSAIIRARVNELTLKGYPVILLTSMIDDANFLCYVGSDYRYSGRIACGILNQITQGEICAGVLIANLNMWSNRLRYESIKEYLSIKYPRISLKHVLELSNEEAGSYIETKDFLDEHTDLQAIFYCSGAVSGGLRAIIEQHSKRKFKVVSFDFSETILKALENGVISFTVSQNPKEQGYRAIRILADHFISPTQMKNHFCYINSEIIVYENNLSHNGA